MSVRLVMLVPVLFTAVGTSARAAEEGGDAAISWVRALVEQNSERNPPPIRLPFVFRTTSEDHRCEGWVRTKKALAAWTRCVRRREELRDLKSYLRQPGVDIRSGWALAGRQRADDIALKVGGIREWSHWRMVSVTYFWTTILIRLLDRRDRDIFGADAMVIDVEKSGD